MSNAALRPERTVEFFVIVEIAAEDEGDTPEADRLAAIDHVARELFALVPFTQNGMSGGNIRIGRAGTSEVSLLFPTAGQAIHFAFNVVPVFIGSAAQGTVIARTVSAEILISDGKKDTILPSPVREPGIGRIHVPHRIADAVMPNLKSQRGQRFATFQRALVNLEREAPNTDYFDGYVPFQNVGEHTAVDPVKVLESLSELEKHAAINLREQVGTKELGKRLGLTPKGTREVMNALFRAFRVKDASELRTILNDAFNALPIDKQVVASMERAMGLLHDIGHVVDSNAFSPADGDESIVAGDIRGDFQEAQEPVSLGDLSWREITVAQLIVRGLANDAIAEHLGLSADTVRKVVASLKKKTRASARAEIVSKLRRLGPSITSTPRGNERLPVHLTPRERVVAILVGKGASDIDIARTEALGISTVRRVVWSILQKFGGISRNDVGGALNEHRIDESPSLFDPIDPAIKESEPEDLVVVYAGDQVEAQDIARLFLILSRGMEAVGGTPLDIRDGGIGKMRAKVPA